MADVSSNILEVDNIEVVYGKSVTALSGLSLKVRKGSVVALLGANGAGKSTTLKAVTNVLPLEDGQVTAGAIRFSGESTHGVAPDRLVRKGMFHVMEGRRIFTDLTVEENLTTAGFALSGRASLGKEGYDLVYGYFPRLFERRNGLAGYLSGGEQQMLAIGRALIAQPSLILLDEPSLGLAPKLVEEIFSIISRINREQGVSMLLVEQNASMAFSVSHHGYIVENGKVMLDGPSQELTRNPVVRELYLGVHSDSESKRRSYR
ncbi:ABC transporter ATP-binding protein [Noviherbaspirillum sp.]|uniref:ABC transporter ATP-binding protein n=1 Tax=Noviherbaspirillum sp. TaxID=1926288 RepID=UPI002D4E9848|nr:ABC transporter ATP-binding protein [Noviherbaspirillum sp.]HZW19995.1 ABC transporter ATP-binding protein [Noviherbaspirillum sp.]